MRKLIRPRYRSKKENTREYRLMKFISEKVLPDQPFIYGGYYSWLIGEYGEPLQLDILFPKVSFNFNKPLAIEVQSDLHRGQWTEKLKRFFKTSKDFEHQLNNDQMKKDILAQKGIPLIEIWPEDKMEVDELKEKISKVILVKVP